MAEEGKVPVQESVGAALRFLRENIGAIAIVSAIGAAALAALSVVAVKAPGVSLIGALLATFASAAIYAALTGAALTGAGGMTQRLIADGGRVWASMAVVGFFLVIVFTVLAIPGLIVFGVVVGPRYMDQLEAAQGDEAASIELMSRIATENPGILLGLGLFYAAIWLALTSRLFLAAPASVDQKRILTFETWAWTKGNMLRLAGARLMLLLPAYILVSAVSFFIAAPLGMNMMDPASVVAFAQANVFGYGLFLFVSGFIQIGLFRALEAGLSAYLYQGLKSSAPAP
jgi:hypothetical protein